jgi:hypothetical protein
MTLGIPDVSHTTDRPVYCQRSYLQTHVKQSHTSVAWQAAQCTRPAQVVLAWWCHQDTHQVAVAQHSHTPGMASAKTQTQ